MKLATSKQFCFFCLALFFFQFHSISQMRQVYLDNVTAENELYKLSFYSPSTGYAAFRDWIGFTTDSGRTFTRKYIAIGNVDYNGYYGVNLTFGFGINGVKAFNQDTLIAYGNYGFVPAILYSSDGGSNFKLVFHSLYNPGMFNSGITDMVFPENNNIGYAVDAERILKTTNKGLNWTVVKGEAFSKFTNVEAATNNVVAVFSRNTTSNKLLMTTSGSVWQTVYLPSLNQGKLTYAFFKNANKGWVSMYDGDNKGYFYETNNGGYTWSLQNDASVTPFACYKMKFTNDSTGYALAGQSTVFKTTNSGKIWEPLPRDNDYTYLNYSHNELFVWNTNQLWAGGGHGFLELSTNAGGQTLPKAFFKIDTPNVFQTNNVKLINYSRLTYQYQWFVNNNLVTTTYHSSYTHNPSSILDSIKLVVSNGVLSDTLLRYQSFPPPPPVPIPTITSFTPTTSGTDFTVTINGTNFSGATAVNFGGVAANSFTVVSPTKITAVVGAAASGTVTVSTPDGTASLDGFSYTTRLKITGFSPVFGPVGSAVTIIGTNFGTSPAANNVRIGGVKANVLSASATQLTVEVPAGISFQPISVTINGATVFSNQSFKVSFAGGCNFDYTAFLPKVDSSTDIAPTTLITADLDGDGKQDVITHNDAVNINGINRLTYHRNTSSLQAISFESKKFLQIYPGNGSSSSPIVAADLDGDGKVELCTLTQYPSSAIVAFQNNSSPGVISFAAPFPIQGTDAGKFAFADFNGDGKPDIVQMSSQDFVVYKNNSATGTLSFSGIVPTYTVNDGAVPYDLGVADINGDGKTDIILCSNYYQQPEVRVYLNTSVDGNISFAMPAKVTVGSGPINWRLSVDDFDGDAKVDVAVLQSQAQRISVIRNTSSLSSISFAPKVDVPISPDNVGLSVGDVTGDGKADLLVNYIYAQSFSVLVNTSTAGAISFSSEKKVGSQSYPFSWAAAVADLNLDGKADVATINLHFNAATYESDPAISIFKNIACEPVPVSSCAGGSITLTSNITGANYQWQMSTDSVNFVNISNNPYYNGTNTATLQLAGMPSSFNGYQYRCNVNGVKSAVYTPRISNNWTGAVSSSWNHSANWSCGVVPDANTDVFINSGNVVLSSNTTVRSITMATSASLTIAAAFSLIVTH